MLDSRAQVRAQWLAKVAPASLTTLTPITGDASFRRYFRAQFKGEHASLIVMDAPPDLERCDIFVKLALGFRQQDICVPQIHAQDLTRGFLLLTDFGDDTLQKVIDPNNADFWYHTAFDALFRIQKCQQFPDYQLPHFDAALMHKQCADTVTWYFEKHLQMNLNQAEHQLLQETTQQWIECAQGQPQVCVHRDFHSRNLMALTSTQDQRLGIIDFQDAVIGPFTHDLVSLLRDCYIHWPAEKVSEWVQNYYEQLIQLQLLSRKHSFIEFMQWFDWVGMQRHYRILGTFARLYHRYHRQSYLQDMPGIMNYLISVSAHYPQFKPFHDWMQQRILPALISANQQIRTETSL